MEKKISDLIGKTSLGNNDELVFIDKAITSGTDAGDGGQTSKIKFSDLKTAVGTSGPQGSQGATGPQGPQGARGNDSTVAGPQGQPGFQGSMGPQGEDASLSEGFINIDDFGAVGDGETDDSNAFQSAIDSFVDWKSWDNQNIDYWATLDNSSVIGIYKIFRGSEYDVSISDVGGYNYWRETGKPNYALVNALAEAEGTSDIIESLPVINGGCVLLGNKRYAIHQTIYLRPHTTIEGVHENPSFVNTKDALPTGLIFLKNNAEINITSTASLTKCYVIKHGLVDTPQYTDQNFSGIGIRITDGDSSITNCFIGGFEYGVYANMGNSASGGSRTHGGRVRLRNLNMDNTNGIYLRESWDISYIENVHMWPFLTPTRNPNGNPISEDFYTFRSGVGISLRGINDWTKITDCFTYGYKIGFEVNKGRNVILKGCGADNTSEYMWTLMGLPNPNNHLKVIPNTIGFKLGDNTDVAFDGNNQWSNQVGTFGHPLLTNCQVAAHETAFQINLPGTELGQLSNCQAWACLTSVKLTGTGSLTVSQSNFDDYKDADWIGLHNAGSGTLKSFGNGFRTLGTGDKQETVGKNFVKFLHSNNSVITIPAQHSERASGTEGGQITLNNTGNEGSWNIDTFKVNTTDDKLRIFNYDVNGNVTWPIPLELYRNRLELTFGPERSATDTGQGYSWPWPTHGTKAGLVFQHHDPTDHVAGTTEPQILFDFEQSGSTIDNESGLKGVYPERDLSTTIWWGLQVSGRKYKDGSGSSISAIGSLYEVGSLGYNEFGLYMGELTNAASTHGTLSGVEVLLKDGPNANTHFDTKMNSVIARVRRQHNGSRQVSAFAASSEGENEDARPDTILTVIHNGTEGLDNGTRFKNGLDLSNADLSEKGSLIMPSNSEIQTKIQDTIVPIIRTTNDPNNPVEFFTNGEWTLLNKDVSLENAHQNLESSIQTAAEANTAKLEQLITSALNDSTKSHIKLPAGRIYLNKQILVNFKSAPNLNYPNSITIEGCGQGTTSLCWINNSSSQGIKINLGPVGSTHHQYVTIRDFDFIQGHQGTNSAIGVRGIALEINGENRTIETQGATNYEGKIVDDRTVTSSLVENCSFQGWNDNHAGWNKCIVYDDCHEADIKHCNFRSYLGNANGATDQAVWWQSQVGVHITGDGKPTDFMLHQLRFWGFETGILCDGNVEGVIVSQGSWVHSKCGIHWKPEKFSSNGTSTSPAQWPLMVVTDCHMNCNEYNIKIESGWQIIIKGNSFYGIDNESVYGSPYPSDFISRSIYLDKYTTNSIISNNTFSDVVGNDGTPLNNGGWGPSIEIDGHLNLVTSNTFTSDGWTGGDEPYVKLKATSSGNTITNNKVVNSNLNNSSYINNGFPISLADKFDFKVENNAESNTTILPNIIESNYGSNPNSMNSSHLQQLNLLLQHWEINNFGSLLPKNNASVDLGSAEQKVRHLFLTD